MLLCSQPAFSQRNVFNSDPFWTISNHIYDSLKRIDIEPIRKRAFIEEDVESSLDLIKYYLSLGRNSYRYYDTATKIIDQLILEQPKLKTYPDFLFLQAEADLGRWYIEKAILEFQNLLDIYIKQGDDGYNIALTYRKIGDCYSVHKNYEQAIKFYIKSNEIFVRIQQYYPLKAIESCLYVFNNLRGFGGLEKKIEYLKKAKVMDDVNSALNSVEKYLLYFQIADTYMEADDKDSAYHYYNLGVTTITKERFYPFFPNGAPSQNIDRINSILKIKEYESSKKIDALKKYNIQSKRTSIFLASSLILLIIVAIVFFRMTRLKLLRKLENVQAIITGEEKERERIAKDLHDEIGASLTNIRLTLNQKLDSNSNTDWSHDLFNQLDRTYNGIRRISQNLLPESLEKLGLKDAILDLLESVIKNTSINVNYDLTDLPHNSVNKELHVYRIIQELTNNAIKHSKARNIFLRILVHDNKLLIEFSDDGIGIQENDVKTGIGLKSIQTRVDLLMADITIDNQQGAKFKISIPNYVKN